MTAMSPYTRCSALAVRADEVGVREGQAGARVLRHREVVGAQGRLEPGHHLAEVVVVAGPALMQLPPLLLLVLLAQGVLLQGLGPQPLHPPAALKVLHGAVDLRHHHRRVHVEEGEVAHDDEEDGEDACVAPHQLVQVLLEARPPVHHDHAEEGEEGAAQVPPVGRAALHETLGPDHREHEHQQQDEADDLQGTLRGAVVGQEELPQHGHRGPANEPQAAPRVDQLQVPRGAGLPEHVQDAHDQERRDEHVVPALPEAHRLRVHLQEQLRGVDADEQPVGDLEGDAAEPEPQVAVGLQGAEEDVQEDDQPDDSGEPSGPGDAGDVVVTMSRQIHARRLDGVDKNIWIEFTQLAADYDVVNLGQGFPDFAPPKFIQDAFGKAVNGGCLMHQYTRAFGHPSLVTILAKFFGQVVGHEINPLDDVLVTVGAYQALFCTFQALVDEGDEVIIIEPFFDCYQPMVKMAGGTPVFVPLRPSGGSNPSSADWVLSAEELASKFTAKTKAIIINTPNNPIGKVYKTEELQVIADLCIQHNVVCISDEVYEWLTYDGAKHVKIGLIQLANRQIRSKGHNLMYVGTNSYYRQRREDFQCYRVEGWLGDGFQPYHETLENSPSELYLPLSHRGTGTRITTTYLFESQQLDTIAPPLSQQVAVAAGFQTEYERFGSPESYFKQLPAMLNHKRNKLAACLESAGLQPTLPEGGYFMIADISSISFDSDDSVSQDEPLDFRFVKWLIKKKGLAAIPVSAFYSAEHSKEFQNYVRFCFTKEDSTLYAAEEILNKWGSEK
ncbi:Kynurenine--oxoglutarate transaminase 1 [Merluccius polli]|uniref:Kynurenine--oxoglutarate transaminase 1 n=1 Tax=Merluccius polli TaxID=89951 RepID=A0AA47MJ67_MERPO|nr:Kynurenine--oxoglutarate transaminase 1 [Merluccius polli]